MLLNFVSSDVYVGAAEIKQSLSVMQQKRQRKLATKKKSQNNLIFHCGEDDKKLLDAVNVFFRMWPQKTCELKRRGRMKGIFQLNFLIKWEISLSHRLRHGNFIFSSSFRRKTRQEFTFNFLFIAHRFFHHSRPLQRFLWPLVLSPSLPDTNLISLRAVIDLTFIVEKHVNSWSAKMPGENQFSPSFQLRLRHAS